MIIGNIRTHTDLAKKKSIAKDLLEIEIANEAENQKRIRNYKSSYLAKPVPPIYKTPSELRQDKDRLVRDAKEKLQSLGFDYSVIQQVVNSYLNSSVDLLIKFNALFPSIRYQIQKNINPSFATAESIIDLIKLIMEDARNAFGFTAPSVDTFQDLGTARTAFNIRGKLAELLSSDHMIDILGDGETETQGIKFADKINKLKSVLPTEADYDLADSLSSLDRKIFYDQISTLFRRQQIPTSIEIDMLLDATASIQSNRSVLGRFENRFSHILPENFAPIIKDIREKEGKQVEREDKKEVEEVDEAISGNQKAIAEIEADLRNVVVNSEFTPEEALNRVISKNPAKAYFKKLTQEQQFALIPLIINPNSDDPRVTSIAEPKPAIRDLMIRIIFEARELLGIGKDSPEVFGAEVVEEERLADSVSPLKVYKAEPYEEREGLRLLGDKPQPELNSLMKKSKGLKDLFESIRIVIERDARKEFEEVRDSEQPEAEKQKTIREDLYPKLVRYIIDRVVDITGDDILNPRARDGFSDEERLAFLALRESLFRDIKSLYLFNPKEFEDLVGVEDPLESSSEEEAEELPPPPPKAKGRPKKYSEEQIAEIEAEREGKKAEKEARLGAIERRKQELEDAKQAEYDERKARVESDFEDFKRELIDRLTRSVGDGEASIRAIFAKIYKDLGQYAEEVNKKYPDAEGAIEQLSNSLVSGQRLSQQDIDWFFDTAKIYLEVANGVLEEDRPISRQYLRKDKDKIKGGVKKTSKREAVPPLTYGLGMKKEDSSSDEEEREGKGYGMKRIPIKKEKEKEKDFKPRRIKVGKGVEVEPEPTYKTFGKYVVHVPYLHNNTANFKYQSLGGIPSIKPMPISNEYKDFILDVLATGKMNEKDLRRLDKKEIKHFEKVVSGAGLNGHFKLNKSVDDEEVKDLARFELLRGEYMAGNNAPTLIKELRSFVLKFMDGGRIKRKDGMGLLAELSSV